MDQNTTRIGVTKNLSDISVEELLNNSTAINMLLHEYQKTENENTMLKQDLTRQATIERTLQTKQAYSKIAGILGLFSTILLSFGINFVTASNTIDIKGWILVTSGIIAQAISLYFSFKGDDKL